MKRPLLFALELLAALALATAGAWIANKVGRKVNAKSNADVRSSYALQALVDVERERLEFERAQFAAAWNLTKAGSARRARTAGFCGRGCGHETKEPPDKF